jgi:hypothetical protein
LPQARRVDGFVVSRLAMTIVVQRKFPDLARLCPRDKREARLRLRALRAFG